MRRAAFAVLVAAVLASACSSGDVEFFEAVLRPDNEVPPRASGASGTARFSFDGSTVTFAVQAANLQNCTQGHIHSGAAGVNGPVRVDLLVFQTPPVTIAQGLLAEGSFTAADVRGVSFEALLDEMRAGTAYVNFHTTTYPGGEIRGQLRLLE